MNYAMKNMLAVYLGYVQKSSENLSDTYKDLMEKKKDFYDEIRRKLGEIN
jgi:hypothetical protein